MGADMNNRTVAGLLAYCDWLRNKGYQTSNAVEAWKVAVKKVFETAEPESWETISLDGMDLDDYVRRFRTLAADQYKSETITVYERRIRNAIEAHEYYLEHGQAPTFRKSSPRSNGDGAKPKPKTGTKPAASKQPETQRTGELIVFPFPLRNGQMAELRLPARLDERDADRLTGFLRSLQFEEQKQIPKRAGEVAA